MWHALISTLGNGRDLEHQQNRRQRTVPFETRCKVRRVAQSIAHSVKSLAHDPGSPMARLRAQNGAIDWMYHYAIYEMHAVPHHVVLHLPRFSTYWKRAYTRYSLQYILKWAERLVSVLAEVSQATRFSTWKISRATWGWNGSRWFPWTHIKGIRRCTVDLDIDKLEYKECMYKRYVLEYGFDILGVFPKV